MKRCPFVRLVFLSCSFFIFSTLGTPASESDAQIENLLCTHNQKGTLVIDAPMHQYLVRRLSPAMAFIPVLEAQPCFLPIPTAQQLGISQPDLVQCLQKIGTQKSLNSLLRVWQNFLSHNFDSCPLFLREFLLVIIAIFSNTSCHLKKSLNDMDIFLPQAILPAGYSYNPGFHGAPQGQNPSSHKPSLQDFVDLYYTMSSLPILELLAAIDTLIMQLHGLVTAYELHGSLTWSQWGARYWWFAPIVLFAVIRIIIKRLTTYPYLHIYR